MCFERLRPQARAARWVFARDAAPKAKAQRPRGVLPKATTKGPHAARRVSSLSTNANLFPKRNKFKIYLNSKDSKDLYFNKLRKSMIGYVKISDLRCVFIFASLDDAFGLRCSVEADVAKARVDAALKKNKLADLESSIKEASAAGVPSHEPLRGPSRDMSLNEKMMSKMMRKRRSKLHFI